MKIPILLPNIFDHPFTYMSSETNLKLGDYVEVPFGKNKKIGIVWDEFEKNKNKEYLIKNVIRKLQIPPLNLETINFLKWFSEYNMVPIGMSLKLHLLSNEAIELQNNEENQKSSPEEQEINEDIHTPESDLDNNQSSVQGEEIDVEITDQQVEETLQLIESYKNLNEQQH